tara:strand:- start:417 stop:1346 length:930 start_codon:yes stop_codon:yes gene_type:complete
MANRQTKIVNFYESTLAALLASGSETTTLTAAPTTDGTTTISATEGNSSTHYFLVIDPDQASNREVVLIKASSGTGITKMDRDVEGRYSASSPPDHQIGTTVRMAVLADHIKDQNDRITAAETSLSDASNIGDGSVSNAEFQRLDGVSSDIQTQIDNISAGAVTLTVPITVKVADDGSGSQNVFYFLSGTDTGAGTRSTNFIFKIGFKYKFDTSDSSLSGHNLKFSLTQDGSHNSGSEFTTNVTTAGTPGSAGASTTIEITPETLGIAGATSTLYYYCSNHSGMGGKGAINLYSSGGGGDIHSFLLMGA